MSSQALETNHHLNGQSASLRLAWDFGTAYDLFVSLLVLHDPEQYDLRASWAAGVRSRLPAAERKLLEDVTGINWVPFHWIHNLPEPKDAASVLWSLRKTPPAERMMAFIPKDKDPEVYATFAEIAARGSWDNSDLERLCQATHEKMHQQEAKKYPRFLDWWARPGEFGELYLSALQAYYQSFFAEEEKRIAPILRQGLQQAIELSGRMQIPDLLAELSQGVHFGAFEADELVLTPSFWSTPLVMWGKISPNQVLLLYGARPATTSLVPGEQVPDGLLRVLKAMADPTRLLILRLLTEEPLTPAQLARRLRLRAPTVTHHLSALRLAGLVHLSLGANDERVYATRLEAVRTTLGQLEQYMQTTKEI